jgi:hypothetical protein
MRKKPKPKPRVAKERLKDLDISEGTGQPKGGGGERYEPMGSFRSATDPPPFAGNG